MDHLLNYFFLFISWGGSQPAMLRGYWHAHAQGTICDVRESYLDKRQKDYPIMLLLWPLIVNFLTTFYHPKSVLNMDLCMQIFRMNKYQKKGRIHTQFMPLLFFLKSYPVGISKYESQSWTVRCITLWDYNTIYLAAALFGLKAQTLYSQRENSSSEDNDLHNISPFCACACVCVFPELCFLLYLQGFVHH